MIRTTTHIITKMIDVEQIFINPIEDSIEGSRRDISIQTTNGETYMLELHAKFSCWLDLRGQNRRDGNWLTLLFKIRKPKQQDKEE
jgi:hypothetical protein